MKGLNSLALSSIHDSHQPRSSELSPPRGGTATGHGAQTPQGGKATGHGAQSPSWREGHWPRSSDPSGRDGLWPQSSVPLGELSCLVPTARWARVPGAQGLCFLRGSRTIQSVWLATESTVKNHFAFWRKNKSVCVSPNTGHLLLVLGSCAIET